MSKRKNRDVVYAKLLDLIGKRIRQVRKERGYTNFETIANIADIARPQWGRYESGDDMLLSTLLHVLVSLNIDFKDFFTEELNQALKEFTNEP
ncbi:helix-turn-helix domain-containing protein [Olivibacter sitiensis]|uniref:helix-turn-helix domain-containing protein n=1 Tax=Olivibacter sitiensis TaxID=376470 RepID=UPI00041B645E|nr:helix-turn-helix transcriptional regulator [Olivibacter sitiensis]